MDNLSENFPLKELTATNTGYYNKPNTIENEKLLFLVQYVLQPIRDKWGRIDVTSGYRSGAVNAAVGGAATSQHFKGEAADIVPAEADIDDVFDWIVNKSGIRFGQCIKEVKNGREWIHISLPRIGKPNQEALVYDGKTYRLYHSG